MNKKAFVYELIFSFKILNLKISHLHSLTCMYHIYNIETALRRSQAV